MLSTDRSTQTTHNHIIFYRKLFSGSLHSFLLFTNDGFWSDEQNNVNSVKTSETFNIQHASEYHFMSDKDKRTPFIRFSSHMMASQ